VIEVLTGGGDNYINHSALGFYWLRYGICQICAKTRSVGTLKQIKYFKKFKGGELFMYPFGLARKLQ
jgi:hypothetical protein